MAATEQDCIDAMARIEAKIQAVKNSPLQAEHHRQLVRQKADWTSLLNKIREAKTKRRAKR